MGRERTNAGARATIAALTILVAAAPGWSCGSSDTGQSSVTALVPACVDDQLAHATLDGTTQGPAIVVAVPDGVMTTAVLYDRGLHDAYTDWGGCMELVRRCYATTSGAVAPCITSVPTCPGMQGGDKCCPTQCIDDFKKKLGEGVDEDSAVNATIAVGTCVGGFAELDAKIFGPGVSP